MPMSDAEDEMLFKDQKFTAGSDSMSVAAEADRPDNEVIKIEDDGEVDYQFVQSDSQKAASSMGPTGPPPKAATAARPTPTPMATPSAALVVSREPPPPPQRPELPNFPIPSLATERLPQKIKIGNFVYNLAEDF